MSQRLSITPDKTAYKEGETVIFAITKPSLAKVHFYVMGPNLSSECVVTGVSRVSRRQTFKWKIPPRTGMYTVAEGIAYFLGGRVLPKKIVVAHAPETTFQVA